MTDEKCCSSVPLPRGAPQATVIRKSHTHETCTRASCTSLESTGRAYLWNRTDLTRVTTSRLALYPAQTIATWIVWGAKNTGQAVRQLEEGLPGASDHMEEKNHPDFL